MFPGTIIREERLIERILSGAEESTWSCAMGMRTGALRGWGRQHRWEGTRQGRGIWQTVQAEDWHKVQFGRSGFVLVNPEFFALIQKLFAIRFGFKLMDHRGHHQASILEYAAHQGQIDFDIKDDGVGFKQGSCSELQNPPNLVQWACGQWNPRYGDDRHGTSRSRRCIRTGISSDGGRTLKCYGRFACWLLSWGTPLNWRPERWWWPLRTLPPQLIIGDAAGFLTSMNTVWGSSLNSTISMFSASTLPSMILVAFLEHEYLC